MNLEDLKKKKPPELLAFAEEQGVEGAAQMRRQELMFAILQKLAAADQVISGSGTIEVIPDGFGYLRSMEANYLPAPTTSTSARPRSAGSACAPAIRSKARSARPRTASATSPMVQINKINFDDPESLRHRIGFDSLTPLYPDEKLKLEMDGAGVMAPTISEEQSAPRATASGRVSTGRRTTGTLTKKASTSTPQQQLDISTRVIDLIAPIGKGQRALIVSPPRTGKTVLMQNIAHAITANNPEVFLMVLLVDERPEEVTDMQRTVKGEVVSSTFDEPASRHVAVAEMVIEKAKRLVEHKRDVVILLDSITRLGRAYNTVVPSSGKVLTGGVDANALQRPKRFFGAARNIEEGGSLTIIATALIDTGSRMDEVIFEEFKGTGNSEIILDRKVADKRTFPAIDITKSGTRKEELLVDRATLSKMWVLRRILMPMGAVDAIEFLLDKLRSAKTNQDFFGR
jgi:transcription termination factor Rho